MSVYVNSDKVKLANKELQESFVKICTIIGFPLGVNLTEVKVKETEY